MHASPAGTMAAKEAGFGISQRDTLKINISVYAQNSDLIKSEIQRLNELKKTSVARVDLLEEQLNEQREVTAGIAESIAALEMIVGSRDEVLKSHPNRQHTEPVEHKGISEFCVCVFVHSRPSYS